MGLPLRGLGQPLRGLRGEGLMGGQAYKWMDRHTDIRTYGRTDVWTYVQIPPVFYRTLSPLVPSKAAALLT